MARNDERPPGVPPGGILLGGTPQKQLPPPKTKRTTEFASSRVGIEALVDEDRIVRGFRLFIIDLLENHTYIFKMDQQLFSTLKAHMDTIPDIGFPMPREEEKLNG